MRRLRFFLIVLLASLFCLTVACGNRRFGGTDSGGAKNLLTNYFALHDSSSPQYRDDCLSCHSDVLEGSTLDPNILPAHQAKLDETPGATTQAKCVFCHTNTDLMQHSAGNIRRNVSVSTCDLCHGPSGPGQQLYQK